jgi:Flp pilus assembly pilin Flp
MLLRLKKEKGAAAVEFALLLPLLVIFVFAIIEFGPAFLYKISFTQVAQEVARMAALEVPSDIDEPAFGAERDAIRDNIPVFAGHPVHGLDIVVSEQIDAIGELVTTTVSAQYDFTIPFVGTWSRDIESTITMPQAR